MIPCPKNRTRCRSTRNGSRSPRSRLGRPDGRQGASSASLSGSLALISEAAHSALDFAATVMTWYAVRVSGKPADEEHHYGHGKVESVTALIETGLLFVLSAVVIWEAVKRLLGAEGHAVEATLAAFAVIIVSIVVDYPARPPALPRRARDRERSARSRRAAFRLRHVVVDRGADRARRRRARLSAGPIPPPRSSSRCSSWSPAGGSAAAPSRR